MAYTNTATVRVAVDELTGQSRHSRPPALIGFDASRHLAREDFGNAPLALDMPISEETIVGAAIGIALAGRDVVVDLMFEGFLSRCVEPLIVGWPTALGLSTRQPGRIVLRMLGAPLGFGGPSHSADVLSMLAGSDHLRIVHVTGPEDVKWGLRAPGDQIVVLADPTRPGLIRGEVVRPGTMPLRWWRTGADKLVVCSHARLADCVEAAESGTARSDVLSSPSPLVARGEVQAMLAGYKVVEFHGVSLVVE